MDKMKKMMNEINALRKSGADKVRVVGYDLEPKRTIVQIVEFRVSEKEGQLSNFTKAGKPCAAIKRALAEFEHADEIEVINLVF